MTDDEIMRQLSQVIRDDDMLAAEKMVTTGQQQHPERACGCPPTTRWLGRSEAERHVPGSNDYDRAFLASGRWVALAELTAAKPGWKPAESRAGALSGHLADAIDRREVNEHPRAAIVRHGNKQPWPMHWRERRQRASRAEGIGVQRQKALTARAWHFAAK
jgi:hypothetical protein